MPKKVLVVPTNLRTGSNSDALAEAFAGDIQGHPALEKAYEERKAIG